MARVRAISPRFFTHDGLYEAEVSSGFPLRVAFAGLWCIADREGRFEWRPRQIKLDVLPFDACDFEEVLGVLVRHGFVQRYEVDGQMVGAIPKFLVYQKPHPREAPSRLPPPPNKASPRPTQGSAEPGGLSGPSDSQGLSGPSEGNPRLALLVARLGGHPDRFAVLEFLENLPPGLDTKAWVQTVSGCLQGVDMPEGREATIEELASACRDFPGIHGVRWNPSFFRGCVARAGRDRRRVPRAADTPLPRGKQAREIEAAARFVAQGEEG